MFKKCLIMAGLLVIALTLNTAPATAQNKPIQVALFNPLQIFPEDATIGGVRLNLIYGKNAWVSGVDFGLVNHTTTGLTKGWQFGLVGIADKDFVGFQNNAVNVVNGNIEGVQWGFVNYAHYTNGLQFGFVNYSASMKGVQVGLVNIIGQGGQFPIFPFVNWSF